MGDIQSILKQRGGKASRSLTPVPEELGKLLKLVNVVPPDAELPDISEMLNTSPYTREASILLEIDKIIKDLPKLVIIYLWLGEEKLLGILDDDPVVIRDTLDLMERREQDDEDSGEEWTEEDEEAWQQDLNRSAYTAGVRYTYLRESREMLRDIARHARSDKIYLQPLPKTRLSISSSVIIRRKDGRLHYVLPRLIKAIEGVEAARIRECEVCKLLFWAGRLDQKACATKCARVLRTRRWREKYQESYKLQRSGKKPLTAKEKKKLADKRRSTTKGK